QTRAALIAIQGLDDEIRHEDWRGGAPIRASRDRRGQFLAPKFLPFVRETNQAERAEIEDHPLLVRRGGRCRRVAEVVRAFDFAGGYIAAPKQLARCAVIRPTLQAVLL